MLLFYSEGPLAGVPFIDDYISTTEQVSEICETYSLRRLTAYSMTKIVSKSKNLLPLKISTWRYACNVHHVICGVF